MRIKIALFVFGLGLLALSACRSQEICPAYSDSAPVIEERLDDNT